MRAIHRTIEQWTRLKTMASPTTTTLREEYVLSLRLGHDYIRMMRVILANELPRDCSFEQATLTSLTTSLPWTAQTSPTCNGYNEGTPTPRPK